MVFVLLLNVAAALLNGLAALTAESTFAMCLHGFAMVGFFVAASINVATISMGAV